MAEALSKYFRVETNSTILPYIVRDHAWNMENHDMSGNFFRYRDDSPAGYSEHLNFACPHATNYPIGNVACDNEIEAMKAAHEEDDDEEMCEEGDDECEAEAAEDDDDDDEEDDADDDEPEFDDDGEADDDDEDGADDEEEDPEGTVAGVVIPDEFHQKSKPGRYSPAKAAQQKPILVKKKNAARKVKKIHNPKNKFITDPRNKKTDEKAQLAKTDPALPKIAPRPIMQAVEEMERKMGHSLPAFKPEEAPKPEVKAPAKVEKP
jgi:hypothetical protein